MFFIRLLISMLFLRNALCYFWEEECDVIPLDGCTCTGDKNAPHVTCSDLDLETVPKIEIDINISILDISRNNFDELYGNCFRNACVQELILTHNNGILNFNTCTLNFEQKIAMIHLTLHNNDLESIPHMIQFMHNLETLDLSNNYIGYIYKTDLEGMTSLRRLDLKGNPIQNMESVFFGMPNLNELSLSFEKSVIVSAQVSQVIGSYNVALIQHLLTKLTLVKSPMKSMRFLQSFANLETLRITRCKLRDRILNKTETSLLSNSRDTMRSVDLSHNLLKKFPSNLLLYCSHLQHLDLACNNIQNMDFESSQYPELEYLDLSENRLKTIPPWFHNESRLTYLDLSNNRITEIQPDAFKNTKYLTQLDLSMNRLNILPEDAFSRELTPGLTMYINENRFECDERCETHWLVWQIGTQYIRDAGPFSWYEVYNTRCTDRNDTNRPILDRFLYETWLLQTECDVTSENTSNPQYYSNVRFQ